MKEPVIKVLLRQLHQAFDTRSWHGPNLMGSLRGVDRAVLAWRPQPARHNIAEIAVHAAYWKYRVFRLITAAPPRSFALAGSNFFERSRVPTDAEWGSDIQLLTEWHQRLASAVERMRRELLDQVPGRARFTRAELISGAAAHDLYHAGQIQLIKRMHRDCR